LYGEDGQVLAEILGLRLKRLGKEEQNAAPESQNGSAIRQPPPFSMTRKEPTTESKGEKRQDKKRLTRETFLATEPEERQQLLEDYLRQQVATSMKLAPLKVDVNKPLEDQGFDSLMAIEVKYRVESELQIEIPVRNLIERPTVAQLAAQLYHLLAEQGV
jgi:acyl carrier protein